MARKSIITRNEHLMVLHRRYSNKRNRLKSVLMDKKASPQERFEASLKLDLLPRNSSRVRIRNRCYVTGRGQGVYRKFKISRIVLRELASLGQIPGMLRSSW